MEKWALYCLHKISPCKWESRAVFPRSLSLCHLYRMDQCPAHLLFSHAAVANLEHVQVVPPPGQPPINVRRHLVDNRQHRAVRTGRDAFRVGGIGARAQVVGTRKRVVDVTRDAP